MNWQVVIMRPRHQAHALEAYVKEHLGQPVLLPMIEIVAKPIGPESYQQLHDAEMVIVSSQNAIKFAPKDLIALLSTKPIMTIGAATSSVLSEQGITVSYTAPTGSQSEDLLTLEQLQAERVKGNNIVLLAGKGGRDLLETTLRSRFAKINKIETYEQVAIRYDLDHEFSQWKKSSKQTCFVVTSLNILNNLLSQTPEKDRSWLLAKPLVVASDRIEQAAIGYGFQLIFNANGADFSSLTKALQNVVKICNTKARS